MLHSREDFPRPLALTAILRAQHELDAGEDGTIIKFSGSIRRCPAPILHPLPRAACRSIRSLCGETVCLLPCVTPCVVAAVRRVKDGGGENEPGLSCTRSRHEKDDDKKDKKKVETVLTSTI